MRRNEIIRPDAVPPTEREYRAAEKVLRMPIQRGEVSPEPTLAQKFRRKISPATTVFRR